MGIKCPICQGDHNMAGHFQAFNKVTPAKKVLPAVTKSLLKEAVTVKSPVTKSLLNAKSNNERVKAWRGRNRAAYNERQRELMAERKRGDRHDSEEEGT